MTGIIDRPQGHCIRLPVDDMRRAAPDVDSEVQAALIYSSGGHRDYIMRLMADRFATKIERKIDDKTKVERGFIARSKAAADAAIQYGLMEVCSLYTFPRIVGELATLYSFGAEYEYSADDEAGTFAAAIAKTRSAGGHNLHMSALDWQSVAVGSGAMLLQVFGDRMNYQVVPRHHIWVAFADRIYDDGELRPTDHTNLDDASCVVVRLSEAAQSAGGGNRYVAMFGASEALPLGRMVTFDSRNWHDIPELNEGGDGSEYVDDAGNICNPMTRWRLASNDAGTPEYPIIGWRGRANSEAAELLPIDITLYHQCREIDLAASRVLMSSLKSARGLWTFEKDQGASQHMPDTIDEGIAMLEFGQRIQHQSGSGSNAQLAMDIIKVIAANTAASYGIPPHRMASQVGALLPSGAALMEANRPLEQARMRRARINQAAAARKFSVEVALASMASGKAVYPQGETETWTPMPEPQTRDRLSIMREAEMALSMGIADVLTVAMDVYPRLDTKEKAQNYIDRLQVKEAAQETPPGALAARLAALKAGWQGGQQ